MNLQELLLLYPEARLSEKKGVEPNTLTFAFQSNWLLLPAENISPTEIKLLEFLLKDLEFKRNEAKNPWLAYFRDEKEAPKTGDFRCLYFIAKNLDTDLVKLWQQNIRDVLPNFEASYFDASDIGVIVEKKGEYVSTTEEIAALFTTLDDDFATNSRAYIGAFFHTGHSVSQQYAEELQLFVQEKNYAGGKRCFQLRDVAIHYLTHEMRKKSILMEQLRMLVLSEEDNKSMIQALWHNKGGSSAAAKELFIHRNTLNYKMEKFLDQTGFSLKEMDDLFLCYLLTQPI